jgi:hypothetical protein
MPSVLKALTAETYAGMRKLLCPYCAVPLPDTKTGTEPPVWKHNIPGTTQVFDCQAQALRVARLGDGASDA